MKPPALTLRPSFQKTYAGLQQQLPQGLLLYGPSGVGLGTIAQSLAGKDRLLLQPMTKKGDVDPGQGTISIEIIRELYEQLKGKSRKGQVAIIDGADRMSHGAQNAFLKLLEEPNSSTTFILTAHHLDQLLPTVRSRVRSLFVPPIEKEQTLDFLQQLRISDDTTRQQLQFIAEGRPAELYRLARSPKDLKYIATTIKDARAFLSANTYDKLVLVKHYSTNRTTALDFVDALLKLLSFSVYNAPQQNLINLLDKTLTVASNLSRNANPKLQLLLLVV